MSDPDPWVALAQNWPAVKIYIRVMPDRWGQTIWSHSGPPYIELAHDASVIQQRCTLAHEYHHLDLGAEADEQDVREATARWLLPDLSRVGVELEKRGVRVAAERLQVTSKVLNDRLTTLTTHEGAELATFLRPATSSGQQLWRRTGPRCVPIQEPGAYTGPARSEVDA